MKKIRFSIRVNVLVVKKELQTQKFFKINSRNEKLYVDAFMQRDDITAKLKSIPDDMLLICGNKSAYVHNMEAMYTHVNKTKVGKQGG